MGEEFCYTVYYCRVGEGSVVALGADALDAEAVFTLLCEDEPLGEACGSIEAYHVVGEVGFLVVGGILQGCEAVYLFVGLAHHDEFAAAVLGEFGDELELALKLQSGIDARVGMA